MSSSVSALFPFSSLSVSILSVLSNGNASLLSKTPSLSSSVSALFPIPSPSVSILSVESKGKASLLSKTPSLSSSVSIASDISSPSKSAVTVIVIVAGSESTVPSLAIKVKLSVPT